MFDNVGEKLKSIAKILWILSIVTAVICPFVFAAGYGVGGFFMGIALCAILLISEFIYCAAAYALGIASENAVKAKLACDFMIQQHKNSDKVIEDTLTYVKQVEGICEELKKLIESKTDDAPEHEERRTQNNILDANEILEKMRQYKELLNLGVITEERFESMKQNLLSSL